MYVASISAGAADVVPSVIMVISFLTSGCVTCASITSPNVLLLVPELPNMYFMNFSGLRNTTEAATSALMMSVSCGYGWYIRYGLLGWGYAVLGA